jgi:hypothetical protein
MRGRSQVHILQKRLDSTFDRIRQIQTHDLEIHSDFARYLCILVSGFIETAIEELAVDHCRQRASITVSSYTTRQLSRIQNLKTEKILQFIGAFDTNWREELKDFMEGPRKDAINSVVELRNKIAHGESVGVTYARINSYYQLVKEVIDFLENKLQ